MLLRTPIDLGFAIRDRRRRLNLDQDDLAKRVGVSRKWIIDVEKGKPRAELGLVLRTLDALGLRLALSADRAPSPEEGGEPVPSIDVNKVIERARGKRS
jgi:HTH-type transcriptional regulator/antitoxin HipB